MSNIAKDNLSARHSRVHLVTGVALGLLLGVGMFLGAWVATHWRPAQGIPEIPLQAVATDSGETFAIATGSVADEVEGIFTLDFLTGDLQCWVINSRTNQIGGYFKYNVVADLGMDQGGRSPEFLMVTGRTGLRGGGSTMRYSECVLYVADARSGNIAGYAVPWNRTIASRGPQQGALIPIFKQAARQLEIRGQQ